MVSYAGNLNVTEFSHNYFSKFVLHEFLCISRPKSVKKAKRDIIMYVYDLCSEIIRISSYEKHISIAMVIWLLLYFQFYFSKVPYPPYLFF